MFPSSVVAGAFNFTPAALLDIPAEKAAQVREAPRVQF
jgi:LemA protein